MTVKAQVARIEAKVTPPQGGRFFVVFRKEGGCIWHEGQVYPSQEDWEREVGAVDRDVVFVLCRVDAEEIRERRERCEQAGGVSVAG
jgi:hypothetical protein